MWLRAIAAAFLLCAAAPVAAQPRFDYQTVAGRFSAACGPVGEGIVATYTFAGERLATLDHTCEPGAPTDFRLLRAWETPQGTTLLLIAPVDEESRLIRLIHFRPGVMPVAAEMEMDWPTSGQQLSTTVFRLVQRAGVGEQHWTCQYDVDFSARRVDTHLIQPSDPDVDDSACGLYLAEAARE